MLEADLVMVGRGFGVVDASVMPSGPCANTNLSTMMIAEKMADHILDDLRRGQR